MEYWDALLGHCTAVSDHLCLILTDELLETYPDAKLILTARDGVDVWYEIVMGTTWKFVEIRISPDALFGGKFLRIFFTEGFSRE
jgi:hypothetical protein